MLVLMAEFLYRQRREQTRFHSQKPEKTLSLDAINPLRVVLACSMIIKRQHKNKGELARPSTQG